MHLRSGSNDKLYCAKPAYTTENFQMKEINKLCKWYFYYDDLEIYPYIFCCVLSSWNKLWNALALEDAQSSTNHIHNNNLIHTSFPCWFHHHLHGSSFTLSIFSFYESGNSLSFCFKLYTKWHGCFGICALYVKFVYVFKVVFYSPLYKSPKLDNLFWYCFVTTNAWSNITRNGVKYG